MVIQQLPKTVGAVKRKVQNAYRGESDLLREYEFTNLCVLAAQRFFIILLWQYTHYVTVQLAPFVKPHFVLIAADAAVLLIDVVFQYLATNHKIS